MYKSIETGVKTPLYKIALENNSGVSSFIELCVISKNNVSNKCCITTHYVEFTGVLRNGVFTGAPHSIYTVDNESDGAINLTGYIDYASGQATISILVTQASFAPTSMVAYWNMRSCCPGVVVNL